MMRVSVFPGNPASLSLGKANYHPVNAVVCYIKNLRFTGEIEERRVESGDNEKGTILRKKSANRMERSDLGSPFGRAGCPVGAD